MYKIFSSFIPPSLPTPKQSLIDAQPPTRRRCTRRRCRRFYLIVDQALYHHYH